MKPCRCCISAPLPSRPAPLPIFDHARPCDIGISFTALQPVRWEGMCSSAAEEAPEPFQRVPVRKKLTLQKRPCQLIWHGRPVTTNRYGYLRRDLANAFERPFSDPVPCDDLAGCSSSCQHAASLAPEHASLPDQHPESSQMTAAASKRRPKRRPL